MLFVLIVLAFGTAIFIGMRNPYQEPAPPRAQPLRSTVIPLVPRGTVPGAEPDDLFQHSPAAEFRSGAEGVTLPSPQRTEHFSDGQVMAALTTAKTYVVESSLDPEVLTGGAIRPVRELLDPDQYEQFDRSMRKPVADGRHAATGWLVRFDPEKVALADPRMRVRGTLTATEVSKDALEVTADHVIVYALRSAEGGDRAKASLFTVRREVRMRFTRDDLRDRRLALEQAATQAGPLPCAAGTYERLYPLLAGENASTDRSAGTDPYAQGRTTTSLCGVLAGTAQPSLPG
ncbi:hypothetical protein [Streptomyces gobiensis]|uniref:SCO2583 family membrane protein n=1 Tax=Streptomyces gobiensis TaxID=2875706 RepID=UPI0030CC3D9E